MEFTEVNPSYGRVLWKLGDSGTQDSLSPGAYYMEVTKLREWNDNQSSTAISPRDSVKCVKLDTGVWRSLAAHLLWEQGVGGSNPLTPTGTRRCQFESDSGSNLTVSVYHFDGVD